MRHGLHDEPSSSRAGTFTSSVERSSFATRKRRAVRRIWPTSPACGRSRPNGTDFEMAWVLVLALALQEERSPLESLAAAQEAAIAQPGRADLQYELGLRYASLGRPNEALEALGRATELAPDEDSYALAYGEVLYRAGRAEGRAARPREADPSMLEPRIVLARVLSRPGGEEEALAELEGARAASP